jgi:hypothetical protein
MANFHGYGAGILRYHEKSPDFIGNILAIWELNKNDKYIMALQVRSYKPERQGAST